MHIIFLFLSFAISYSFCLKCYCSSYFQDCYFSTCNTSGFCIGEISDSTIIQRCLSPNHAANACNVINEKAKFRLCCVENLCNSIDSISHFYHTKAQTYQSSIGTLLMTSEFSISTISSGFHINATVSSYNYSNSLNTNNIIIIIPLVFVIVSALSLFTFCVLVTFLIIVCKFQPLGSFKYKKHLNKYVSQPSEYALDITSESGSGSGMAQLSQVTIARQIVKHKLIGSGRYGEVWQGVWRDQFVAIKIFYSIEAESWEAETNIYMTDLIRHENILGFIGADKIDIENCFQYWLVTDYMVHGSLLEYLPENILNLRDAFRLAKSAVAGVSHLHSDIKGGCKFNANSILYKPCIVHRDIKSKNILVNSKKECIIADFGLAVHLTDASKHSIVNSLYKRVGTKRYMSPELLCDEIDVLDIFEVYKRADVYSLSLVLWEIFRRCEINGFCEEYQLPYFDSVSKDPDLFEMQKLIVLNRIRPVIPNRWGDSRELNEISHIIRECLLVEEDVQNHIHLFAPSLPSHLIKKRLFSIFLNIAN